MHVLVEKCHGAGGVFDEAFQLRTGASDDRFLSAHLKVFHDCVCKQFQLFQLGRGDLVRCLVNNTQVSQHKAALRDQRKASIGANVRRACNHGIGCKTLVQKSVGNNQLLEHVRGGGDECAFARGFIQIDSDPGFEPLALPVEYGQIRDRGITNGCGSLSHGVEKSVCRRIQQVKRGEFLKSGTLLMSLISFCHLIPLPHVVDWTSLY